MPIDPAKPFQLRNDHGERHAHNLAELELRVRELEQGNPIIQVTGGAPAPPGGPPREGAPVADRTGSRFGVYLPTLGGWKWTNLA